MYLRNCQGNTVAYRKMVNVVVKERQISIIAEHVD